MDQLEAALDCGVTSVIADFRQPHRYGNAVRTAHLGGASILLATPRIHKPGEGTVPIFAGTAASRGDENGTVPFIAAQRVRHL